MTEKLAEAIANMYATFDWHGELDDRAKVLEAARAYNDLPVVDVEEFERECLEYLISHNWADGRLKPLIQYIRTTYPNGLRWKND
jgi:hypothetical protein